MRGGCRVPDDHPRAGGRHILAKIRAGTQDAAKSHGIKLRYSSKENG
jgi:hypothetical protein